jgi:hypothetical protein
MPAVCPKCNRLNSEDASACRYCGAKLLPALGQSSQIKETGALEHESAVPGQKSTTGEHVESEHRLPVISRMGFGALGATVAAAVGSGAAAIVYGYLIPWGFLVVFVTFPGPLVIGLVVGLLAGAVNRSLGRALAGGCIAGLFVHVTWYAALAVVNAYLKVYGEFYLWDAW